MLYQLLYFQNFINLLDDCYVIIAIDYLLLLMYVINVIILYTYIL